LTKPGLEGGCHALVLQSMFSNTKTWHPPPRIQDSNGETGPLARRFRRRGATLVEAAFVLSGLLVFLFAIFDYGRFIMIRHIVDNAAREGCRLAVAANATDTNSFNYQTTTTIQNA